MLLLRVEWTWAPRLWIDNPHSPKLEHYWSLSIRLFSVIPEKGRRIQPPKRSVSTYHNKDEDNSPKNHNQNNADQASSQKFRQIISLSSPSETIIFHALYRDGSLFIHYAISIAHSTSGFNQIASFVSIFPPIILIWASSFWGFQIARFANYALLAFLPLSRTPPLSLILPLPLSLSPCWIWRTSHWLHCVGLKSWWTVVGIFLPDPHPIQRGRESTEGSFQRRVHLVRIHSFLFRYGCFPRFKQYLAGVHVLNDFCNRTKNSMSYYCPSIWEPKG